MSEIKKLSLEKATCEYVKESGTDLPNITADHFKAGANWQKEQDKELIAALDGIVDYLNWRGVDNCVPEYAYAKEILKKHKS